MRDFDKSGWLYRLRYLWTFAYHRRKPVASLPGPGRQGTFIGTWPGQAQAVTAREMRLEWGNQRGKSNNDAGIHLGSTQVVLWSLIACHFFRKWSYRTVSNKEANVRWLYDTTTVYRLMYGPWPSRRYLKFTDTWSQNSNEHTPQKYKLECYSKLSLYQIGPCDFKY